MAKKSEANQRDRFIQAAREAGADDDPKAFRERLKKLVKAPGTPQNKRETSPAKKED
jgi:hypothetical protein